MLNLGGQNYKSDRGYEVGPLPLATLMPAPPESPFKALLDIAPLIYLACKPGWCFVEIAKAAFGGRPAVVVGRREDQRRVTKGAYIGRRQAVAWGAGDCPSSEGALETTVNSAVLRRLMFVMEPSAELYSKLSRKSYFTTTTTAVYLKCMRRKM